MKIDLVCDSDGFIYGVHPSWTNACRTKCRAHDGPSPSLLRPKSMATTSRSRQRGTAIRASGSGVGGGGSEPSFPTRANQPQNKKYFNKATDRQRDTSKSRSWYGTKSIVPGHWVREKLSRQRGLTAGGDHGQGLDRYSETELEDTRRSLAVTWTE